MAEMAQSLNSIAYKWMLPTWDYQLYKTFFEHKETAGRFLVGKSFLETITLGAPRKRGGIWPNTAL